MGDKAPNSETDPFDKSVCWPLDENVAEVFDRLQFSAPNPPSGDEWADELRTLADRYEENAERARRSTLDTTAVLKFDGGARPTNPGPGAIGYTIEIDGNIEERGHDHIGKATSNEAEYHALIQGLQASLEKGCSTLTAKGDSQLIVNQVRGEWDTNEEHLRELRDRVQELAGEFEFFDIRHISRDENGEAHEMVGQAFES